MKKALQSLASLKLSMVLLVLAMVLVYAGTWAQIGQNAHQVQKAYFHAWLTWVPFGVLLPQSNGMMVPGGFPTLGGYSIGLLMVINLLASWFTRFTWTGRKVGVHLVHVGVVLLLVGEAWTSVQTQESYLTLSEGQTKSYTEDQRKLELAVIDRSSESADQVWSVSHNELRTGRMVADAQLPVKLKIVEFAQNADILGPMQTKDRTRALATAGSGVGVSMIPAKPFGGVDSLKDTPAAYVLVMDGDKELGTYLLVPDAPMLAMPQQVKLSNGRELYLQMRYQRYYMPYQVTLLKFRQEMYPGTNRPKAFESTVRLVDRERGVDREEKIWMNHPLRYRGETLYQSGAPAPDTSVLAVVRNPAYTLPYIACIIGAIGMVLQFGVSLNRYLSQDRKRKTPSRGPSPAPAAAPSGGVAALAVPLTLALVVAIYLVGRVAVSQVGQYEIAAAPVFFEGRLQPLDSVARNTLRIMNGRADVTDDKGNRVPAMQWLMGAICRPQDVNDYPAVLIENPEVATSLGLDVSGGRKRFSISELGPKEQTLDRQLQEAESVPSGRRDLMQRQIVDLGSKLNAYGRAAFWEGLMLVPPVAGSDQWRPLGEVLRQAESTQQRPERIVETIATSLTDYQKTPSLAPTANTVEWLGTLEALHPAEMAKVRLEVVYNRFEPFLLALGMYTAVFLLACASMLIWRTPLWRSAMVLGVLTLLVHSVGIGVRIYLQGRPPVTNLYSSAIFIGWGAVLLALGVELIHRNGIAIAMASLVGAGTLIVAQNLAQGGDTMGALQAVLDSNFWLTTHVLAITYGYSAVFVAGAFGIAYVVAGIFAADWFTPARREGLSRMIYGVSCFAMLFSFVGTILGGIWADQSWGRFWGWDPKENGAVLIVIWMAIVLHARWVGAGGRGLALMAVFGNVVTVWSWFGTNLLGVGLHSYGFMEGALMGVLGFVISQLIIIAAGWALIPADAGSGTGSSEALPVSADAS